MSSTNSSSEKCNITSRTWNSEDMVTSNLSSETGISQLMGTASTFIYPTNLSASTHELKNTSESQQSNVVSVPQNSIFDFISVEELRKLAEVSNQIYSSTPNPSTLPVVNHAPVTPVKPIQPALFNSSVSSPRSEVDGSERSSSPYAANEENNNKKKATGGRKRKAESLEEKEQRQRERILRNRHAAQMSRDKKRRQMADLESQNVLLKEENAHLSKRLKIVEEENMALSAKLDTISAQLAEIQSHITVSEMTKVLLDGVRGSAASAALADSLALNDGKEENKSFNDTQNEILESSSRYVSNARESSKKSQQRHVKMWNLYGTLSQIHSFPIWMLPTQILKQLLLTFSIVFWTTTGQRKNFLLLGNRMVFADDVVILELTHCFNKKRRMRSVKALRGRASKLKRVPRDWRKYPP